MYSGECVTVGMFGRVASKSPEVSSSGLLLIFLVVLIFWSTKARKGPKIYNMKAHMEEVEDDLAAEEENKLINEVRRILIFYCLSITAQQSVALFQEYKTW
jgi:hypothetical protein